MKLMGRETHWKCGRQVRESNKTNVWGCHLSSSLAVLFLSAFDIYTKTCMHTHALLTTHCVSPVVSTRGLPAASYVPPCWRAGARSRSAASTATQTRQEKRPTAADDQDDDLPLSGAMHQASPRGYTLAMRLRPLRLLSLLVVLTLPSPSLLSPSLPTEALPRSDRPAPPSSTPCRPTTLKEPPLTDDARASGSSRAYRLVAGIGLSLYSARLTPRSVGNRPGHERPREEKDCGSLCKMFTINQNICAKKSCAATIFPV